MAKQRFRPFVADNGDGARFDEIVVAYIPDGSRLDDLGDGAIDEIRRAVENLRRTDDAYQTGVRLQVIAVIPGSFVVLIGIAVTGYKIVADYSKFKDSLPVLIRDLRTVLERLAYKPVSVHLLGDPSPSGGGPNLISRFFQQAGRIFEKHHDLILLAALLMAAVVIPLVTMILVWRIHNRIP